MSESKAAKTGRDYRSCESIDTCAPAEKVLWLYSENSEFVKPSFKNTVEPILFFCLNDQNVYT